MEEVASFAHEQVTGVAVSTSGRLFVNFPNWSADHTISVAEIVAGKPKPFPNEEWNAQGAPASHFVCVQSVVVDTDDYLWVLDPAAPEMKAIVPGGPKLVKIDLSSNQVVQTIAFDSAIAPAKSYLNDVRIDTSTRTAYITDSGLGAIVVVDLQTGAARRLLAEDSSTKAEPNVSLTVQGNRLHAPGEKTAPPINVDGIALDSKNRFLYFHALTGHTLYRARTEDLRNTSLSAQQLAAKVENLGRTPAPDGMLADPEGQIFLTAIEQNAIVRFHPETKKVTWLLQDKRLSWPDSMSWGPDGALYVTASQIQNMPRFNDGRSRQTEPYRVFKIDFKKTESE